MSARATSDEVPIIVQPEPVVPNRRVKKHDTVPIVREFLQRFAKLRRIEARPVRAHYQNIRPSQEHCGFIGFLRVLHRCSTFLQRALIGFVKPLFEIVRTAAADDQHLGLHCFSAFG